MNSKLFSSLLPMLLLPVLMLRHYTTQKFKEPLKISITGCQWILKLARLRACSVMTMHWQHPRHSSAASAHSSSCECLMHAFVSIHVITVLCVFEYGHYMQRKVMARALVAGRF